MNNRNQSPSMAVDEYFPQEAPLGSPGGSASYKPTAPGVPPRRRGKGTAAANLLASAVAVGTAIAILAFGGGDEPKPPTTPPPVPTAVVSATPAPTITPTPTPLPSVSPSPSVTPNNNNNNNYTPTPGGNTTPGTDPVYTNPTADNVTVDNFAGGVDGLPVNYDVNFPFTMNDGTVESMTLTVTPVENLLTEGLTPPATVNTTYTAGDSAIVLSEDKATLSHTVTDPDWDYQFTVTLNFAIIDGAGGTVRTGSVPSTFLMEPAIFLDPGPNNSIAYSYRNGADFSSATITIKDVRMGSCDLDVLSGSECTVTTTEGNTLTYSLFDGKMTQTSTTAPYTFTVNELPAHGIQRISAAIYGTSSYDGNDMGVISVGTASLEAQSLGSITTTVPETDHTGIASTGVIFDYPSYMPGYEVHGWFESPFASDGSSIDCKITTTVTLDGRVEYTNTQTVPRGKAHNEVFTFTMPNHPVNAENLKVNITTEAVNLYSITEIGSEHYVTPEDAVAAYAPTSTVSFSTDGGYSFVNSTGKVIAQGDTITVRGTFQNSYLPANVTMTIVQGATSKTTDVQKVTANNSADFDLTFPMPGEDVTDGNLSVTFNIAVLPTNKVAPAVIVYDMPGDIAPAVNTPTVNYTPAEATLGVEPGTLVTSTTTFQNVDRLANVYATFTYTDGPTLTTETKELTAGENTTFTFPPFKMPALDISPTVTFYITPIPTYSVTLGGVAVDAALGTVTLPSLYPAGPYKESADVTVTVPFTYAGTIPEGGSVDVTMTVSGGQAGTVTKTITSNEPVGFTFSFKMPKDNVSLAFSFSQNTP